MIEVFSSSELLICLLIVFISAMVQMSIGMGFGMIASPLIALVKPEIVPGAIMMIGLFVALSGAWRERGNIIAAEVGAGIGGRIIGSASAFLLLLSIKDLDGFLIAFGLLILLAICLTASGIKTAFTIKNLFGLSILSGLMGTVTAVGAPPMAIIYHDRPANIVRPTLNAFFAGGCVLGLVSLGFSGWLQMEDVWASLILLPAMVLGIYLSRFVINLSARWISSGLLGLSAIASIMLIFRGFF